MFKYFRLGVLILVSIHVIRAHSAKVNMCDVSDAQYAQYASDKKIATARYATNYACDYEINVATGSSTYCVIDPQDPNPARKLPVPASFYLANYYHANNTCGTQLYDYVGQVKSYKGQDDNICLVSYALQTIPDGMVLSTKAGNPTTCSSNLGLDFVTVKTKRDGIVWCRPNSANDPRVVSSYPKGYFLNPASGADCPSNTTPFTLDTIGSNNSGDTCISSYSEIPDRAFVATKRLNDDFALCGPDAYRYTLTKVKDPIKSDVCSIANTFGNPPEYVIKGMKKPPVSNCWGYSSYDIELAFGDSIRGVCPQTQGMPTGYFIAPSNLTNTSGCNWIFNRLSGSSVEACLTSSQKADIFPGWYPYATTNGACPQVGMRGFTVKKLSGGVDTVVWFNTSWWRPANYAIVPRTSNCPDVGPGVRCSDIAPAVDGMKYCNVSGQLPAGFLKGGPVNDASLICPGGSNAFYLEIAPPPKPVSNPATFVNPEPPVSTKPTVPVLDVTCPGDKC